MKQLSLFLLILFFFTSCASYVNKMHRRISYEEKMQHRQQGHGWPYPKKNSREYDRRPVSNPITYTSPQEGSTPPTPKTLGRYTASDFIDQDSGGSLWGNYDGIRSAENRRLNLQLGEIVVINVLQSFKEDISRELRRHARQSTPSFMPATSAPARGAASARRSPQQNEQQSQAQSQAASEDNQDEAVIVYDKIPSRVHHELSNRHVILKGSKEVFFRNDKLMVEVEAMVLKEHIAEDGSIHSDHIIESRVKVMR